MYRIKVACVGKGGKLEVIEFNAPKPSICYGKDKWQGKKIQAVVKRPICYFCGNDFAKERYTHLYEGNGEEMDSKRVLICPQCVAEFRDEVYADKEEKAELPEAFLGVCHG